MYDPSNNDLLSIEKSTAQLDLERRNSSNFLEYQTPGLMASTPVLPKNASRPRRKLASELEKLQKSSINRKFSPTKARTRMASGNVKQGALNWARYEDKFP